MSTDSLTAARPFVVALWVGGAEVTRVEVSDLHTAYSTLAELLEQSPGEASGAWAVASGWPEAISLVVRFRPGVVGERQRVAHIITLAPGQWHTWALTTLCGRSLLVGEVEFLQPGQGMPCMPCFLRSRPFDEQLGVARA
ncbi:hypothetical protein [Haloactinomyces albus]|uniref:Uncharacterized protein n=1 Tax=Haloactinomyces albus TaxID=1352928 RepID=A0AAE4CNW8_9ACTN|nr:hypothetical protein [Haloactinomyces albus]MDR7303866.1 hypothetical protein [Haloactinomyces albus]